MGSTFQILGYNLRGGLDDPGNMDFVIVGPEVVSPIDGEIVSVTIYVVTPVGNIRAGIYDSNGGGGYPGALLGESASVPAVAGWQEIPLTTPVPVLAGQPFWMAQTFDDNACVTRLGASNSAEGWVKGNLYGPLPDPFPAGANFGDRARTCFCRVNPG